MQAVRGLRRLALLAFLVLAAQPSAAQVKPLYYGAAHLYSLADVTVVYPARPGRAGDTNRLSAERRAEFLRAAHGMQVEVAADDSVSPEQLQGNLLLLGWGNALLPADEAIRPIVDNDEGRWFLGDVKIAPGDDLLFGWGSPHNPKRFLVFWSRIDLELDRFLTLPFVGSDWAIFRDFLILGQGQFAKKDGWPPERNPYGERPPDEPPPFPAGRASEHYLLRHSRNLLGEDGTRKILAAREAAWKQAAARLGGVPEDFRIELFVYRDRAELHERTGVRDMAAFSIPARGQLHMTRELAELDSPREDLHVLAREALGPAALSAMYEGLAVALEQAEEESNLAMYAAALEEHDRVPSIAEMLDEERLRVLVREGVGRPAAGLLVRWIRANADDATFRRAYTLREGGTGALAALLGMEAGAMEKSFAAWLGAQAEASRDDYRYTKMLTDARKLGTAGDRAAEQAALRKALEVRPGDPETLYLISLSQLRGSDFAGAEKTLSRLLEATADRKGTTIHVLAVYRMGQALDRLGRTDEALERFESLLGLPDRDDSHRLARKAIEKIGKRRESGD